MTYVVIVTGVPGSMIVLPLACHRLTSRSVLIVVCAPATQTPLASMIVILVR